MKLIVGLGNIGLEFKNTRHNIGFEFVDKLAEFYKLEFSLNKKFDSLICEKSFENRDEFDFKKIILAKPINYMNLSGIAVRKLVSFYKLDMSDLIIVHDDVYLELGKFKIKNSGGDGGHNGVKNIIANLNNKNFSRIKIGVGFKDSFINLSSFVLKKFNSQEILAQDKIINELLDFIIINKKFKLA